MSGLYLVSVLQPTDHVTISHQALRIGFQCCFFCQALMAEGHQLSFLKLLAGGAEVVIYSSPL